MGVRCPSQGTAATSFVPDLRPGEGEIVTVRDAVREYVAAQHVSGSDKQYLKVVVSRIGTTRLLSITYQWAES